MKRGFFFSLAIFLLLTYVVLSIAAWTASVQVTERRMSERFELKNAQVVISEMDEGYVKESVHTIAYNSLRELADWTAQSRQRAIRPSGMGDATDNVPAALDELVRTQTARGQHFQNGQPFTMQSDSLRQWKDQLAAQFREIGYTLTLFDDGGNVTFRQKDPHTIEYQIALRIRAENRDGRTVIDKTYPIADTIDISGGVDPLAYRMGLEQPVVDGSPLLLQKQFFFDTADYPTPKEAQPKEIKNVRAAAGQKWFYGKLVGVEDAGTIPATERPTYILVGTYGDITKLNGPTLFYTDFGAYLLTNKIESIASADCPGQTDQTRTFNPIRHQKSGNCKAAISDTMDYTPLPFAVVPGFTVADAGTPAPDPRPNDPRATRPALLFESYFSGDLKNEDAANKDKAPLLFNMERLRDFALCAYYTQSPDAPSYFQRLLSDGQTRRSKDLGIESMLVGSYIGGVAGPGETLPTPQYWPDTYSRLDRELFSGQNGERIRGMPGCKAPVACASDSPIGHFRLGTDGRNEFGGNDVQCNDGRASCG